MKSQPILPLSRAVSICDCNSSTEPMDSIIGSCLRSLPKIFAISLIIMWSARTIQMSAEEHVYKPLRELRLQEPLRARIQSNRSDILRASSIRRKVPHLFPSPPMLHQVLLRIPNTKILHKVSVKQPINTCTPVTGFSSRYALTSILGSLAGKSPSSSLL
jgi:hypothetical protein